LPDITIGDIEDNGVSDNNYFVFTNAFNLDAKASDAETASANLYWSFAEAAYASGAVQDSTTQWFEVNGKNPLSVGNANIATGFANAVRPDLVANGSPTGTGGTKNIRESGQYATFRDIVLSPGWGPLTSAFASQTAVAADHNRGKFVWFFVSDGTNVTSKTIVVKSLDEGHDTKSPASDFTPVIDNQYSTSSLGWQNSGTTRAGFAQVDYQSANGALRAYSGTSPGSSASLSDQFRIIGWKETEDADTPGLSSELKYSQIGTGNWLRAKYFMFAEAADSTANVTNINKIPDMRLRISGSQFSFASLVDLQHHSSGGDALLDGIARDMAPSTDPLNPTVYRVDMVPPVLAAYTADPTHKGYVRMFETYSQNNEVQENGYLCLTESNIGTYPIPTAITLLKTYGSADMNATAGGGNGQVTNLAVVYHYPSTATPTISIESAASNGAALGSFALTPTSQVSFTPSTSGYTIDTQGVDGAGGPDFHLGVATLDWVNGNSTDTNATRARVEVGLQYRVRFTATSTVAASIQAQLRFRSSSVSFNYNPRLEVGGSQGGGPIAVQYLPGTGGYAGTYDLVYVSPFTINPAAMALATGNHLGAQPATGSATASPYRDIKVGFDVLDELVNPNIVKGRVTVSSITVESMPLVSD
jgi:hypothetical protein